MNLRRHNLATHVNKLYVAIDKNGKDVGHTMAYSAKEAAYEFRGKGIRFRKIRRS